MFGSGVLRSISLKIWGVKLHHMITLIEEAVPKVPKKGVGFQEGTIVPHLINPVI